MKILDKILSLKEYAPFSIRLIIGIHLIIGTQDNVFSWDRMLEFRDFLENRGVVWPLLMAHVSVYAQFLSGICFIVGWQTRLAASIMIINFIFAILIAHLSDPYSAYFPALFMLAGSVSLLLSGSGKVALDKQI